MPSDSKKDYDVGFGKPPTHSRFKPGQSGNPGGRPKGVKREEVSLLEQVGSAKIIVTENGRKVKMSKREASLVQLVNNAASGDIKSIKIVEELLAKERARKANDNPSGQVLNIVIDRADADL